MKSKIQEVYERWLMRNGDVAVIQFRCGSHATGTVEGSLACLGWTAGKNQSGAGYDLVEELDTPRKLMERLAKEGRRDG